MSARTEHQALTKQMLMMRAAVERAELEDCIADLREAVRPAALIRSALPQSLGDVGRAMHSHKWLETANMLRRHPLASSLISFVVARIPMPRKLRFAGSVTRTAVKLGGLGLLAWQGWNWWKSYRAETR